jgi:hypothetical protein
MTTWDRHKNSGLAVPSSWKGVANSCPGTRALRSRFANGCLDWSERRPHIGGALGAALLSLMLKKKVCFTWPRQQNTVSYSVRSM